LPRAARAAVRSYYIVDRDAEARLLPLARERAMAVIANRPIREGALLRALERHRLPAWAHEAGAASWAPFAMKFISDAHGVFRPWHRGRRSVRVGTTGR
jgi:aryl-alcohol dehydrogenase-like predicted oxidoreductase